MIGLSKANFPNNMQVFTPFPSLKESVCCLDPSRLGNQIYREALTLIRGGWKRHPVSLIWTNHKHALAQYCIYGLDELKRRGRDYPKWYEVFNNYLKEFPDTGLPKIFGYEPFHKSHASNLIRKKPDYYQPIFGVDISDNLPYLWSIV
jgi:hypothetical protein